MLFAPTFNYQKFLRLYWQKKPLLIRSGGQFTDPLDPETLAGMSCEAAVESRIVTRTGRQRWQQTHGPFTVADFKKLGDRNWTLLVQSVDQWWPQVQALKADFKFLPDWRIDDVMISFATRGGGVGPHFDYYDVFLLQGRGSRKWQVGARCDHTTPLQKNSSVKLLKNFTPLQEFTLECGDMLYLPPRYAHHGVSLDDSLCYSVGFRAPSFAEMIEGFGNHLADILPDDMRYEDSLRAPVSRSGEISADLLQPAFHLLQKQLRNPAEFREWFGRHATLPRNPDQIMPLDPPCSAARLVALLRDGACLTRNPFSRFAFSRIHSGLSLFVDGRSYRCGSLSAAVLDRFCTGDDKDGVAALWTHKPLRPIIVDLVNLGSLEINAHR